MTSWLWYDSDEVYKVNFMKWKQLKNEINYRINTNSWFSSRCNCSFQPDLQVSLALPALACAGWHMTEVICSLVTNSSSCPFSLLTRQCHYTFLLVSWTSLLGWDKFNSVSWIKSLQTGVPCTTGVQSAFPTHHRHGDLILQHQLLLLLNLILWRHCSSWFSSTLTAPPDHKPSSDDSNSRTTVKNRFCSVTFTSTIY